MFLGVQVHKRRIALSSAISPMISSQMTEITSGEPPGEANPKKDLWKSISAEHLAEIVQKGNDKLLIIDSRSFLEYNTCHVREAINVCCSKLVKRRLQHDKVTVRDLLAQACHLDPGEYSEIIVYDQCSVSTAQLSSDCFLMVLLQKLVKLYSNVCILQGGFLNFQASHPSLCETKSTCSTSGGNYKCMPMTSMSQPCLPVSNLGPTKILPYLYLGSKQDALSQETLTHHSVTYILNVSTTCPKPTFIKDSHFHRIPVNDNYSDKLSPHFVEAFQFIDKVREANGCVLVHCLAGISRSPTVAIAYVMKHLKISSEEAYKYVKDKRPTISPNFNFLGQLMELDKQSKKQQGYLPLTEGTTDKPSSPLLGGATRKEYSPSPVMGPKMAQGMRRSFSLHLAPTHTTPAVVQSPTTALARLNFNSQPSPVEEMMACETSTPDSTSTPLFPSFPTTSLDCLSFTPCLTKEEHASRSRHSSGNNNNTKTSGGTKRPLSTSHLDNPPADHVTADLTHCGPADNSTKSTLSQVVCRSPESKAKRPLVRPNSIAFSTYPKFDFGSELSRSSASPVSSSERLQSPMRDSNRKTSKGKVISSSQSPQSREAIRYVEGRAIQMRIKEPGSSSLNKTRKSQSLEDLQAEQAEADWSSSGSSRGKKGKHSHRPMNAADLFSQPVALDHIQGRCRGPSDPHQSSSSISSSGSHNSLQGSMEMIPVS